MRTRHLTERVTFRVLKGSDRPAVRRTTWTTMAILALLGAWDVTRPPRHQLGAALAVAAIRTYQASLSPWMERSGIRCRFTVSCSRYGAAVIERDGLLGGSWRAAIRLLRCGPWTPAGTVDNP